MTIHVSIDDTQMRLAELIAAARQGEEVVLNDAGVPQARLIPIERASDAAPEAVVARRLAILGIWKGLLTEDESIVPPSMTDKELEERFERKFGASAGYTDTGLDRTG